MSRSTLRNLEPTLKLAVTLIISLFYAFIGGIALGQLFQ